MKNFKPILFIAALLFLLVNVQCNKDALDLEELSTQDELMKPTKSPDGEETAGNNLSYPVIWTDGPSIDLRGERWLAPRTDGIFYLVWGEDPIDPQAPLYSCLPDPDDPTICEDGSVPGTPYWRAYVQKDLNNEWQAFNYNGQNDIGAWVIDKIDWGDNLESVDWTIRSQVRTEIVLYEAIPDFVEWPDETGDGVPDEPYRNEYNMRHAFGWGITEVHGLQTNTDNDIIEVTEINPATVYTPNARLTIQKINVESRDDIPADNTGLNWDPITNGWTGGNGLFNPPIINMAAWEGGDGPGSFSAEVNVKGKVIFGYTWNVRDDSEDLGYYRITFSLDDQERGSLSPYKLNTLIDGTTEIIRPEEEEILAAIADEDEGGDTGGAWPEIDNDNKLTYIDVLIRKNRGSGGGNGGGKDRNPGGGDGGGKDGNNGGGSGSGSGNGRK